MFVSLREKFQKTHVRCSCWSQEDTHTKPQLAFVISNQKCTFTLKIKQINLNQHRFDQLFFDPCDF